MSRYGLCLAAGVLLAAPAFVSGSEKSVPAANEPVAGSTGTLIDGGRILLPVTTGFVSPDAGGQKGGGGGGGQASSPAPVISTAPAAVETVPPFPQNQCFCMQPQPPSPFHPVPYYVGQLTTVSPRCEKLKLQFGAKPVFEQLALCEELGKCWKQTGRYAEKGRGLEKELAAAREKYRACCPGAGPGSAACDDKCFRTWEIKIRKLEQDMEKNDKAAVADRGKCVSGFIEERMRVKPAKK